MVDMFSVPLLNVIIVYLLKNYTDFKIPFKQIAVGATLLKYGHMLAYLIFAIAIVYLDPDYYGSLQYSSYMESIKEFLMFDMM
jgi:hypothetical protein